MVLRNLLLLGVRLAGCWKPGYSVSIYFSLNSLMRSTEVLPSFLSFFPISGNTPFNSMLLYFFLG